MKKDFIPFLDMLRGPAALLVVWDHFLAEFPNRQGFTLPLVQITRTWVNTPLGIIQDFGWLGVCLFFLISGFVITHVAQREGWKEFLIKRVFRIYPLLALTVPLAVLLLPAVRASVSFSRFALNASLLNYFFYPQVVFIGVAWTLAVEVLFYASMLLLYPLRRQAELLVTLELFFILGVIALSHTWGNSFFLFAATVAYLPYLIVGQLFYFGLYAKRLPPASFIILLGGCFWVLWLGLTKIHVSFLSLHNSYLISFGWAVIIFLIGLLLNTRLSVPRVFTYLAYTSYTIYLLHGIVGDAVLHYFFPRLGYTPALVLAFLITAAAVVIVYGFYERPLLRWGQKMSGGQR